MQLELIQMQLHVLIVLLIAIIAKIQQIVIDAMKDILGMLQLKLVILIFLLILTLGYG